MEILALFLGLFGIFIGFVYLITRDRPEDTGSGAGGGSPKRHQQPV